jgi:AbrB family looped-hinge helix DNA binding protein
MEVVTISPKFQVVIPQRIREVLKLRAGQKVQALIYQNRIEYIPLRPASELRGFLRGVAMDGSREDDAP